MKGTFKKTLMGCLLVAMVAQNQKQKYWIKTMTGFGEGDSTLRSGFMVLGMHRSGTSMLSGLLHTGCGYNVGKPLLPPASDNEKGFFERVDMMYQNDLFLQQQGATWDANVLNYDGDRVFEAFVNMNMDFATYGMTALEFFNNTKNVPWMQKDPRMCITLKTWLNILRGEPAILFTYRHPLEVAMSLKQRANFPLDRGLRLWIVYNMRAIQNSKGLCVVKTSNDAILADPMNEIQRIVDEFTNTCNIPPPPFRISQEDVDRFIDPDLQHNKEYRTSTGGCKVLDYESNLPQELREKARDEALYQTAIQIYCDLQRGETFKDNYAWPTNNALVDMPV